MVVYTDGSATPTTNGFKGGYGVVVYNDNGELIHQYQHFDEKTTNNEQELKAILYAMIRYGQTQEMTTVYTDSSYALNTLTSWMYQWADRGWITNGGKVPENLKLVQTYYKLCNNGYRINLQKIKGHNGHEGNEYADALATGKIKLETIVNDK